MRKWLMIASLFALLLAGCGTLKNPARSPEPTLPLPGHEGVRYVPGKLFVGYRQKAAAEALARALGGELERDFAPLKIALIRYPENLPLAKVQSIAKRVSGLRYVEPEKRVQLSEPSASRAQAQALLKALTSGDPDLGKQWMHDQLKTPAAWAKGITGRGIRIGIHDTFMDFNHPDLKANVAFPGFYGTTATIVCPDTPYNGKGVHGTMVAGTAAAVANNGIGGRGVAYEAQIVPLSIDDPDTGNLTTAGIVLAGLYAVLGPEGMNQLGFNLTVPAGCRTGTPPSDGGPYVDIVNMSWGGSFYDQVTKDVMDFMLKNGIVLVTSAGNTPTTGYAEPAWLPGLISVAATEANNQRTNFSNRGLHLTVAAPGENIWTPTTRACLQADPTGASCPPDAADYAFVNGTSFSSPATAGVAALVLEAAGGRGSLDARQVRTLLSETAWDVQGDGYDEDLGWGIVDAEKAVAEALKIKNGERTPPDPGANVTFLVYDKNTSDPANGKFTGLPMVGVTLERTDGPRRPELQFTQTTGTGIFSFMGLAHFLQIDPGHYRVYVGGPYPESGVEPDAYVTEIDVQSGNQTVAIPLDVQLPQDPYEPNNDLQSATPASVGKSYYATLYDQGGNSDADYYEVSLDAGTPYYFNTETRSGNADLKLEVYDANGQKLAENSSYQDFNDDALLVFTPPADGTYYLKVYNEATVDNNSPFNAYALDLAVLTGSETEPNGSADVSDTSISNPDFSQAESLNVGEAVEASIDPQGDVDIFKLNLAADVPIVADTEAVSSGKPDTMLALYDASGSQVAFNDDYTGRESRLEYTPTTAGTYYLVVVSWDNATTGDYTLSVTEKDQP